MAFKCYICGKKPVSGKLVSHSKKRSLRIFKPNLQKRYLEIDNKKQTVYICTRCIRTLNKK